MKACRHCYADWSPVCGACGSPEIQRLQARLAEARNIIEALADEDTVTPSDYDRARAWLDANRGTK
jgi:hypothetical protein